MIEVQYKTSRGTITKHYPASNFPCGTIIKLVQTGVTVTINSVIEANTIEKIQTSTSMLDFMEPIDTSIDLSEG